MYSLTLREDLPGRLQRLGTTPTPARPGRQVRRLRGARRRLLTDVKFARFSSYCWLRSGDTRPGPRLNFSSPPELPTDGLYTSTIALVIVIVVNYRTSSSLLTNIVVFVIVVFVIVVVHHQFKRNSYLSLFCDWIFLCLQNHFSFLSSK